MGRSAGGANFLARLNVAQFCPEKARETLERGFAETLAESEKAESTAPEFRVPVEFPAESV
jgi:hypothetical protein